MFARRSFNRYSRLCRIIMFQKLQIALSIYFCKYFWTCYLKKSLSLVSDLFDYTYTNNSRNVLCVSGALTRAQMTDEYFVLNFVKNKSNILIHNLVYEYFSKYYDKLIL